MRELWPGFSSGRRWKKTYIYSWSPYSSVFFLWKYPKRYSGLICRNVLKKKLCKCSVVMVLCQRVMVVSLVYGYCFYLRSLVITKEKYLLLFIFRTRHIKIQRHLLSTATAVSDHLSFTTENSVWYIPLKYIYFGGQLNFVVTRLDNIPPPQLKYLVFGGRISLRK